MSLVILKVYFIGVMLQLNVFQHRGFDPKSPKMTCTIIQRLIKSEDFMGIL